MTGDIEPLEVCEVCGAPATEEVRSIFEDTTTLRPAWRRFFCYAHLPDKVTLLSGSLPASATTDLTGVELPQPLDGDDYTAAWSEVVGAGGSISAGRGEMGCVTHSVPPYPPPPYNPRAYPAGPGGALDCRTADEKTAARLDEMGAALRRLEGEVAALRGEMRQLGAGRVSWETPVASTEGEPYEDG